MIYGRLAQLGERLPYKQNVSSSILLSPTKRKHHVLRAVVLFFLPFFFFLYNHITSCIRDSLHFVRRFAPSKCVRCGTSSILLSPTIMKSSTCSAPWCFFLAFFLFSLQSYNLLHPRLTTFCASLCSFKMCSLRNQFDPVIAHHNEKFHVLRAVGFFIAISLFSLQSYNLLHPRLTIICASLCSFK